MPGRAGGAADSWSSADRAGVDFFGATEAVTDQGGYAVSPPLKAGSDAGPVESWVRTPGDGQGLSLRYDLTVTGTAPPLPPAAPPTGYEGRSYSFALAATGVPAPTFTGVDALPSGLALSSSGQLSGVVASAALTVSGSPPSVALGDSYYLALEVAGFPAPNVRVLAGSGLPATMFVTATGELGGWASVVGTFPFTLVAQDELGRSATLQTSITVTREAKPVGISGSSQLRSTVGAAHDWDVSVTGYPGAHVERVGLPTAGHHAREPVIRDGDRAGDVLVHSCCDQRGRRLAQLPVTWAAGTQPTLTVPTLPATGVGEPFSYAFVSGGAPAPALTAAGELPPGMTFTPSGVLTRKPTQAGTFTFTVSADNGFGKPVARAVTLTVQPVNQVSIGDATVREPGTGYVTVQVPVTLSRATAVPVSLRWKTGNLSAKAPWDYRAMSGTLVFAPGQTARVVGVSVLADRVRESAELFSVLLVSPVAARLLDPVAMVGVRNRS